MELDVEQKSLAYGEFILPKKSKSSQIKNDESQGSFVRVKPNTIKLRIDGDKVTVLPKIPSLGTESPLSQNPPSQGEESSVVYSDDVADFDFDEPDSFVPRRADEIAEFLADDKRALKLEKNAVKLLRKYEDHDERIEERASKIRRPIGVKLVVIISLLLITAVGGVTYAASLFMTQDTRANAEDNNLAMNARTTLDTENRISSAISSVTMFLDLLSNASSEQNSTRSIETLFFERNKDIVAVYYARPNAEGEDAGALFASDSFLISHDIEKETVLAYMTQESESAEKAKNGSIEVLNATPFFTVPLISLFCPVSTSSGAGYVAFLYSTAEIGESFASGSVNQSFFVNNDGIVLVHSDLEKMNEGTDLSESEIVKEMLNFKKNPTGNGQIPFIDENGDEYIGAYRRLNIGNGGVITIVKTSVILEGVRRITYRNLLIMAMVIALAIMITYFFAKSLSRPLRQLTAIVNEVNKGNFNTDLFDQIKMKRRDEIGILERSTRNEREILNMVSRLTNKGVTKAVITKQIDFEPHLKDITIFFSDIRGFTAISDGFKKRFGERSAAEIIGFLNDYMSRMVTCINKTGGTVDKFEGDAIMAVWGVLRKDDLDWEKLPQTSVTRILKEEAHREYVKADALSAITCCIAMRYSLMKYNKDALAFTEAHKNDPLAQYKPHIQIGAGLNSGRATVGFMGSFDKMEFTSIGDSVNFASRAEASNKPCGTDILITEDTYNILKKDYIRCEENNFIIRPANIRNEIVVEKIPVAFEVKGKGKQHFYGVVNMPNFDIEEFFKSEGENFVVDSDCELAVGPAGPKSLKELRALLGIATPDFEKVNLDAEENKIQVAAP